VLLVPSAHGPPRIVKDYASCSRFVRWLVAPLLVRHELAILERLTGLPGVPAPRGRVDRLALAMEYIDGIPLRRKSHRAALPRSFFDSLEGILDGLALRGVTHFDLRSPSNILSTRATGAPALVDLASAVRLPLPRCLAQRIEHYALSKLRARFEHGEGIEPSQPQPLDYEELHLGRARVCFLDRGRVSDPVPALFLHDVGHSAEVFHLLLESAAAHARRGIGLDLPGFGRSSFRVRSLSPPRVAKHVAILMDALRLARVDLVGYGWGGLVACVLAARQPERVRSVVTLDTPLDCLVGGFRKRWDEARRDPEVLRRRLLREIPPGLSEEVRGRLERAIKRAPSRALRLAYADIPVRERSRAGANGELMLVGVPTPSQPWLAVCSDALDGCEAEPRVEDSSAPAERWSQPLANPSRFWGALERLARSAT
jgi:pimeloyl-ACP methyl ester carboxylesterase